MVGERAGKTLRVASRGSRLARAQVEIVRDWLSPAGYEVEPVIVETRGDRGDRDALGAFVREVQVAVIEGRADLALHCLKDLPTELDLGLELRSFLPREDPRDALITRGPGLDELPDGFRVGTSSLRRATGMTPLRPDAECLPIAGNVDSRLSRLISGEFDALILAMAGIQRLGGLPKGLVAYPFDADVMVPAAGQGVLVLEGLPDGPPLPDDVNVRRLARLERRVLSHLGGGCSRPIGVYAELLPDSSRIKLSVMAASVASGDAIALAAFCPSDDPDQAFEAILRDMEDSGLLELLEEDR